MAFKTVDDNNIKDFKNFKMSELKCKCGGKYCNGYPVGFSYELLRQLQEIRNHFNSPVIITSAVRCQRHNDSLKGSVKNSKHIQGRAVDFYVKGISYSKLKAFTAKLPYKNYEYNISGSVMHRDITPPEGTFNLTRLLKKGTKGNDVKELQRTLGGLTIDGIFGNQTLKKTKAFQKSKGLTQDGIVGKNTAHALGWTYKGK